MTQPESRLQRKIRKALKAQFGGYWYKVWGGPYQPAGLPDLSGVVRGRAVSVEVKRPTGEVSRVQRSTQRRLRSAGAVVAVAKTPAEAIVLVAAGLEGHPQCLDCFELASFTVVDADKPLQAHCDLCGSAGP